MPTPDTLHELVELTETLAPQLDELEAALLEWSRA
ncbi:MAG: hypothetical protein K0R99_5032 [Microbacterium sp.]|jgi:hypothetical protein|nr:hypothetical protein [Microbacterium sp.]